MIVNHPGRPLQATVQSNHHTILVVDDSADVRLLVAMALKTNGYKVAQAEDGASALRYLEGHEAPSLIILDVRMPGMDGFQFRERQVAMPSAAKIPVLVYSAEPDMKVLAESLPADAYVSKSASLATMVSTVQRFLC